MNTRQYRRMPSLWLTLTRRWSVLCSLALASWLARAESLSLPAFDFTSDAQNARWGEPHHLADRATVPDGLLLTLAGNDPWIVGPPRDFPTGTPLWLHLRLKSEQSGTAQVFYFPAATGATEANSVRFPVTAGDWFEAKLRLPALGPAHRLRIDPPGAGGTVVLQRLWFTERVSFQAPAWPKPEAPQIQMDDPSIASGELKVVHSRRRFGAFAVEVAGERMAVGNQASLIGYVRGTEARWFAMNAVQATVTVASQPRSQLADAMVGGRLTAQLAVSDPDGGRWQLQQVFTLDAAGALQFEATARCDQERDVLHLPLFTLLPGLGGFGTNKTQALLAGVEYLDNEPSSSTADLNPPGADRQVPDTARLTFPLMAMAAKGRYLAVAWNQPPDAPICAMFDSPDRLFHSGGHVMGLLFPGSDGLNRDESSLVPYEARRLPADRPVRVAGLLLGGVGSSVVPAVKQFVQRQGLPELPQPAGGADAYFNLAAHGWLDSKIRDSDLYHHATPGFRGQPAADAAVLQTWLAGRVGEAALSNRLVAAAAGAQAKVPAQEYNRAQIGHVRQPLPALVFGSVPENLAQARRHAQALLGRFEADGFIRYRKSPDGLDYGRTHAAPDANGLTAQVLGVVLQEALFTGDRALADAGLRHLRALADRFHDAVPRGAQTWEIPLHTPDILASAYLVKCFVIGHELTRDPALLEEAKYWAWTGVPFVYLNAPTRQPVGVYATTPVLGATQWIAPNWIGLPVQWCGLVYADAIQGLAWHDPQGPWSTLARGIVLSAIQQTYPVSDRDYLGLLPDSFNLRGQTRNPANINAATVLVPAIPALGEPALYDYRVLPRSGLVIHAPGILTDLSEPDDDASFTVHGWPASPYFVLVNRLRQRPQVSVGGQALRLEPPHHWSENDGVLVLRLRGTATVRLSGLMPQASDR